MSTRLGKRINYSTANNKSNVYVKHMVHAQSIRHTKGQPINHISKQVSQTFFKSHSLNVCVYTHACACGACVCRVRVHVRVLCIHEFKTNKINHNFYINGTISLYLCLSYNSRDFTILDDSI